MLAFMTGCLDGTPDYRVPTQVPPVIDTFGVDPVLTRVRRVDPAELSINFTIPFRSEDVGQRLKWFLVRDVGARSQTVIDSRNQEADPRPFDEQDDRSVSLEWILGEPRPVGCHTVTWLITYIDNVAGVFEPADNELAATATWVFDFGGDGPACPEVAQ